MRVPMFSITSYGFLYLLKNMSKYVCNSLSRVAVFIFSLVCVFVRKTPLCCSSKPYVFAILCFFISFLYKPYDIKL